MIQVDSRKVKQGDIFVAIKGFSSDGHNFAKQAEQNGAVKIYCEHLIEGINIPQEVVSDTRKLAGELASDFFGRPSEKMKVIGITGTNGKTTTTYMVKNILETAGFKVGLIGTNQNMIGDKVIHTEHTTPESVDLQALFAEMYENGCEYVVMEVSSHALALERVSGTHFAVGAFTNLTQDHLDFHKDFDDYFNAKSRLFEICDKSVINVEHFWGKKLFEMFPKTLTVDSETINFELPSNVVGKFNRENAGLAYGICKALNIPEEKIIEGLQNFKGVCGRMEVVYNKDFKIIIDYAHTPDGIENILRTAREFAKGKLKILFGCGGDRDNTKRPIMGKIASELADFCVVTSDNPRTENPSDIIDEILAGMENCDKIVIENRLDAIKYIIETAKKNDVIILAGKGHEDYQIIGKEKIHFDEHEIVRDIIGEIQFS